MLVLGQAFVSPYLLETASELGVPVVQADSELPTVNGLNQMPLGEFFAEYARNQAPLLSNTENALQLLMNHLPFHEVVERNTRFKNKVEFRKRMAKLYPDFTYSEYTFAELMQLSPDDLPYPVVVKPAVGYSSIGVHRVANAKEWRTARLALQRDMMQVRDLFKESVLDSSRFIVEEWIEGEEYAVDAYFDAEGQPVVLSLFKRMFANASDMSDRIYFTSKQVMLEALQPLQEFLTKLGKLEKLRLYPLHMEVRISPSGALLPIEVNPLRFAGIGTCDLSFHAYGHNPYQQFFSQTKPDWESVLASMDDAIYSFFCAELPVETNTLRISRIEEDAFRSQFGEILEYRSMAQYDPTTFAVVFYRSQNIEENKRLLHLDLAQFIRLKDIDKLA